MSLLEVLVAVALLGTAGLAMIGLVRGQLAAVAGARARESETADEDRLMAAYSLLTRPDLDQRLGSSEVGDYRVNVAHPQPNLYRIAIGRRVDPDVEDLVTVVRRASTP